MNAEARAHLKSSEKSKCDRLPEKVLKEYGSELNPTWKGQYFKQMRI